MHLVQKKELICENTFSKIKDIIPSSHSEENLEQHDTILNVSQMRTVHL